MSGVPGITFAMSAEAVERIAERAAELVLQQQAEQSPWLTRAQAAAYLSVPVSRLEKDRTVPCRRWEGRVMYHRGELDQWADSLPGQRL